MKFKNKSYFLVATIVLVVAVFIASSLEKVTEIDEEKLMELCNVTPKEYEIYKKFPPPTCWDGVDTDAAKLMELCNVTPNEYKEKIRENKNFCPEGEEAFLPTGGCYAEPFCPEGKQAVKEVVVIRWLFNK